MCVRISCCCGWCVLRESTGTAELRGGMDLPLCRQSHAWPRDGWERVTRRHGASNQEPPSAPYKITTRERFDPPTDERRCCSGPSPCITLSVLPARPASGSPTELITRQIEIGSVHGVESFRFVIRRELTPRQNPSLCLTISGQTLQPFTPF